MIRFLLPGLVLSVPVQAASPCLLDKYIDAVTRDDPKISGTLLRQRLKQRAVTTKKSVEELAGEALSARAAGRLGVEVWKRTRVRARSTLAPNIKGGWSGVTKAIERGELVPLADGRHYTISENMVFQYVTPRVKEVMQKIANEWVRELKRRGLPLTYAKGKERKLVVSSTFRPAPYQRELIQRGYPAALVSEHTLGVAFDISSKFNDKNPGYEEAIRSVLHRFSRRRRINFEDEKLISALHSGLRPQYVRQLKRRDTLRKKKKRRKIDPLDEQYGFGSDRWFAAKEARAKQNIHEGRYLAAVEDLAEIGDTFTAHRLVKMEIRRRLTGLIEAGKHSLDNDAEDEIVAALLRHKLRAEDGAKPERSRAIVDYYDPRELDKAVAAGLQKDAYSVVRILQKSALATKDEKELTTILYNATNRHYFPSQLTPVTQLYDSELLRLKPELRTLILNQRVYEVGEYLGVIPSGGLGRMASGEPITLAVLPKGRESHVADVTGGWFGFSFRDEARRKEKVKLYVGAPLDKMKEVISWLVPEAIEAGAHSMKVSGTPDNLLRMDNMMVYFDDTEKAKRFAAKLEGFFRTNRYESTRPPFTGRLNDYVGIGYDRFGPNKGDGDSGRHIIARAIARATKRCRGRNSDACIKSVLNRFGLDPRTLMPTAEALQTFN